MPDRPHWLRRPLRFPLTTEMLAAERTMLVSAVWRAMEATKLLKPLACYEGNDDGVHRP